MYLKKVRWVALLDTAHSIIFFLCSIRNQTKTLF